MPRFDLPITELENFNPDVECPEDFDRFWRATVDESMAQAWPAEYELTRTSVRFARVYDVRYSGFMGEHIAAWLLLPGDATAQVPAVVVYPGYGSSRGYPHEHLKWPAAGIAAFVVDNRGQGSSALAPGVTPDPHGSGPSFPGMMTKGIESPESFYYRRLIVDAVAAVDAAARHPAIDPSRVVAAGASQGGGLALAVAGLNNRVAAALIDVPFLCHFRRAVGMTDSHPYEEVAKYLATHRGSEGRVFHTLSYFDGVNFARRGTAPALFSVGGLDPVCPPSTVFAARNAYAGTKGLSIYEFNKHEGGGPLHWLRQMDFLHDTGLVARSQ